MLNHEDDSYVVEDLYIEKIIKEGTEQECYEFVEKSDDPSRFVIYPKPISL